MNISTETTTQQNKVIDFDWEGYNKTAKEWELFVPGGKATKFCELVGERMIKLFEPRFKLYDEWKEKYGEEEANRRFKERWGI